MYGYIYKTVNRVNGKIYIGKHKGEFTTNYLGSGKYLQNAIKHYGIENFSVELLEYCETLEIQNEREKYWIKYYLSSNIPMYNISKGGDGGDTFYKLNESDRKSRIGKLKSNGYFSNLSSKEQSELSKKAWVTRRANGNDKFSDEYKRKLSESHKGHVVSDETKEKIRKANTGKVLSEEHKQKISLSNKGKHTVSDEQRKRLSERSKTLVGEKNPFYGKTHSDETRIKIGSYNKTRFENKVWINNGVCNKRVEISEVDRYLSSGYTKGRIKWQKH